MNCAAGSQLHIDEGAPVPSQADALMIHMFTMHIPILCLRLEDNRMLSEDACVRAYVA